MLRYLMTHCVKGSAYVPNHGMWTNLVSLKKMANNKCSGIITILDYVRRGGLGRGSLKARWRQASAPPGIHRLFAWGCTSVLLVFPSLLTTCHTPSLSYLMMALPKWCAVSLSSFLCMPSCFLYILVIIALFPPAICVFYCSLPGLLALPCAN